MRLSVWPFPLPRMPSLPPRKLPPKRLRPRPRPKRLKPRLPPPRRLPPKSRLPRRPLNPPPNNCPGGGFPSVHQSDSFTSRRAIAWRFFCMSGLPVFSRSGKRWRGFPGDACRAYSQAGALVRVSLFPGKAFSGVLWKSIDTVFLMRTKKIASFIFTLCATVLLTLPKGTAITSSLRVTFFFFWLCSSGFPWNRRWPGGWLFSPLSASCG